MVFSSTIFLFVFLPCVWLINRYLPRSVSNVFLCVASLVFYAWGEPVYMILLILLVLMNYLMAKGIDQARRKKARLVAGVALNISALFAFKYTDFTLATLDLLPGVDIPLPGIMLPIGVSFFIFQAMSYLVDAYRGDCAPQRSFMKLLLYVSFFPQLIAGPIIYYHDIERQIEDRRITSGDTAAGIRRFVIGLSKKVLIANTLAVAVDAIYALEADSLSLPACWIAALAYILQLYYDFSGYSDMALGLGKMFGFSFKENFDYPYLSTGIREFWQRWHMSLSGWFREYVYIPLGGNRKGALRTAFNKITVFFLTGLWHGASWTFVVWGLVHGVFLLLEQYVRPLQRLGKRVKAVGIAYTLLVLTFTFVLFRSDSFSQALVFLRNMVAGSRDLGTQAQLVTPVFIAAFCAGILGAAPWARVVERRLAQVRGGAGRVLVPASYAAAIVLLALCMLSLSAATHNPFIYFRF